MSQRSWWAALRARFAPRRTAAFGEPLATARQTAQILVVVEGSNDVRFLSRVSAVLNASDPAIPNLARMERRGELIFVPCGGGDPLPWTLRLTGLGPAEFHLRDRDDPPEIESRRRIVELVNLSPRRRAALTRKRSLENYLHPDAIFEASGVRVDFSDDDNVAELVARRQRDLHPDATPWDALSRLARKRRREKVKKWLNSQAAARMTPERIARRDPEGEIVGWLKTIAQLAGDSRPAAPFERFSERQTPTEP